MGRDSSISPMTPATLLEALRIAAEKGDEKAAWMLVVVVQHIRRLH